MLTKEMIEQALELLCIVLLEIGATVGP